MTSIQLVSNVLCQLKQKLASNWFTGIILAIAFLLTFELIYLAQTAHSAFEITILYIIAFTTLINVKSIYGLLKSE